VAKCAATGANATMPKARPVFVCDSCGSESHKWEGRCPSCGDWNTMAEFRPATPDGRGRAWTAGAETVARELSDLSSDRLPRLQTASAELNRVLGGGVVPGSVSMVAGDPGIGKSTLLLRVAADVASSAGTTLYVTGEESADQIKLRADRLGISGKGLFLLQATGLGEVMGHLESLKPALAVVDSIQTVYDESLPSSAGSLAQIRECTRALMRWAKSNDVPVILTGHVTKGGDIAGPRVLEHMVDVVLYMEGDAVSSWRLLRAVKNRFGSTNEIGVFEMSEKGLIEVEDPSRAFLAERRDGAVGSVVVATIEGSRPLLAEVQALTSPSFQPAPRRVATGVDFNRLLLVCAVLSRRVGVSLAGQDVVVSVTGGLRIGEPAADLGMALAIVSSLRNVPLRSRLAAIGEIGLSGEVRMVPQLARRIDEVERLGLRSCLAPVSRGEQPRVRAGIEELTVATLGQAMRAALAEPRLEAAVESEAALR